MFKVFRFDTFQKGILGIFRGKSVLNEHVQPRFCSFRNYKNKLKPKTRYQYTFPFIGFTSLLAVPVVQENKKEKKKNNVEIDDPVILVIKHAIVAQLKQDDQKAVEYLHKALVVASDEYNHNRMTKLELLNARVYVYDFLANIAFSNQEYKQAENLYIETMKGYLESGKEQTDNAVVEISMKLASIYAIQDRKEDAVHGYKFCIDTQRKKLAEDPQSNNDTKGLLGMALEGYGRYLFLHNDFDNSLTVLTDAMDISKSLLGDSDNQTLIIMNDLAMIHIEKKNYNMAESILTQAIKLGVKVDSNVCPSLYCNLGAVYMARSQIPETITACKKGFSSAKKHSDDYAMDQAKSCLEKVRDLKKQSTQ